MADENKPALAAKADSVAFDSPSKPKMTPWGWFALLGTAFLLLTVYLGETTGLHGDEAWSILKVEKISQGERPLRGMNSYTGPLHLYLMWPVFEVFGFTAKALRGFGAFFNLVLLASLVLIARELCSSQRMPGWFVGWLTLSSHAYIMFGRFGTEVTSLVPAMIFFSLWLGIVAVRENDKVHSFWKAALGGVLMGIAIYTHVIAICVPFSVGVALLLVYRAQLFRQLYVWVLGVGMIIGCSPLFIFSASSDGSNQWGGRFSRMLHGKFLSDLADTPVVILRTLDGSYLYQRFVGEVDYWVFPYAAVALGIVFVLRIASLSRAKLNKHEQILLLSSLVFVVVTLVISSRLSLRYFLYFELAVPLIAVVFSRSILDAYPNLKRVLLGVAGACVLHSVIYLPANYYLPFAASGGKCSVFDLGTRLRESSNHFVQTNKIYEQLKEAKVDYVYAKDFIAWPMRVLDLEERSMKIRNFNPMGRTPKSLEKISGKVVIVLYNEAMTTGTRRTVDYRDAPAFKTRGLLFRRAEDSWGFDERFLVYFASKLPPEEVEKENREKEERKKVRRAKD